MKYLKLFEEVDENFEIGDYIFIEFKPNLFEFCKIISVPTFNNSTYYGERSDGKIRIFFKDEIIKKMTPKEIEQYEIEKNAKKYNL